MAKNSNYGDDNKEPQKHFDPEKVEVSPNHVADNLNQNYGFEEKETLKDERTLAGKIQRIAKPYAVRFRRFKFWFAAHAKMRRLTTITTLLLGMLFVFVLGQIYTQGLKIEATEFGKYATFLTGDKIKINGVSYDKKNRVALVSLQGAANSGLMNPNSLESDLVIEKKPKMNIKKAPTIQVLPTYNNHYTLLIKNVYPDFGTYQILLKSKEKATVPQIGNHIKTKNRKIFYPLDKKDVKTLNDWDKGSELENKGTNLGDELTHINDAQLQNNANYRAAEKLTGTVMKHNVISLIIKNKTFKQNQTALPNNPTPKNIILDDLITTKKQLEADIKAKKHQIKLNNDQINTLNRQKANVEKNNLNNASTKNFDSQISNLQSSNRELNKNINTDRKLLNNINHKINLVKHNKISFKFKKHESKAKLLKKQA